MSHRTGCINTTDPDSCTEFDRSSSYNIKNQVTVDEQEQRTGHCKEQWDTSHVGKLLCNFCYSNKKSAIEYCLPKQHFPSMFGRRDKNRVYKSSRDISVMRECQQQN
ncbi:hypothetical protein HZH68_016197 [Vespula germanica]|uniref:Uncharacterized protein n=1 Tax=Vespula germanica TaxID=30212 RepID=A0A834J293_VESGE|nr:hypothetical protein HZH68_016197 [Vespula germanica]